MGQIVITLPKWEANVIIILLSGDNTNNFDDKEVQKARTIIASNGFKSLAEVRDIDRQTVMCTFLADVIRNNSQEHIWIIRDKTCRDKYEKYGLFPFWESEGEFHSFESKEEKEKFCSEKGYSIDPHNDYTYVENITQKLDIWWKSQTDNLRRTFSPLPSFEHSWTKFDIATKLNIYNYCIIKENSLELSEFDELAVLNEISSELGDIALEMVNNKSIEGMCDSEGSFLENYQDQFNRLYDEIGDSIMCLEFTKPD